ncbi:MAG: dihydrodipicolinate synthase family protein [Planctomycetota bacterium]|jgi:4-hydroxy-tetrahydrodipicolinate synthase
MSGSTKIIEGLVVPLLTPVDAEERVDESAMRSLIRHCLDGGAKALFTGGTSGMGPLWPMAEWQRMMEIAIDEVANVVPLLGGVIEMSTARAIERIRILERMGYEHIVVTSTYYIAPETNDEFLSYFGACRDATDMNMIVYNIPSCTNTSIPVEVIAEMAKRGWTQCIKESSGDKDYFSQLIDAVSASDTAVLQGNEPDIAWGLKQGARGIVPVCANYAPSLYGAICQAAAEKDDERMDALQQQIMAVRETLLLGDKNWVAGAMYGISTLGIGSGAMLHPIQKVSEAEQRKIQAMTQSRAASDQGKV